MWKLMNGDILLHAQNSSTQVEDQYNLYIFCVKVGKRIRTNVNRVWENLAIDPI